MDFCYECKKRSHILVKCKCDFSFCLKHLVAEKHNCTHNYRLDKDKGYEKEEKRIIKI
jgi:predicted nucleic acid binding AN1-type Zn finger protein